MKIKGIHYDAGVDYAKWFNSRPVWRLDDVRHDFLVIRDQLHCNSVSIMSSDATRLAEASWRKVTEFVRQIGVIARRLEAKEGTVGMNVGCELTLFSPWMVPGGSFARRSQFLPRMLWLRRWYNYQLNKLLKRLVAAAQENFTGPLTYGAGLGNSRLAHV